MKMLDTPIVHHWMDRPVTELSRDELLEVIAYLADEWEHQKCIPKDYLQMVRDRSEPEPAQGVGRR